MGTVVFISIKGEKGQSCVKNQFQLASGIEPHSPPEQLEPTAGALMFTLEQRADLLSGLSLLHSSFPSDDSGPPTL